MNGMSSLDDRGSEGPKFSVRVTTAKAVPNIFCIFFSETITMTGQTLLDMQVIGPEIVRDSDHASAIDH